MRARTGIAGVSLLAVAIACGGRGDPAPGAEPALVAQASTPVDSGQGGTTRWVKRLGGQGHEYVMALATGSDGSTTLLTAIGVPPWGSPSTPIPSALGLVRLDRAGAVSWAVELPNAASAGISNAALAVSPLGNVFVALMISCGGSSGCALDLGQGPITGGALFKFEPPGTLVWQRGLGGLLTSNVAVDSHGGPLVAYGPRPGVNQLLKYQWDGTLLWEATAPPGDIHDGAHLAFGPGDTIAFAAGLGFAKLDARGNTMWTASVAASPDAVGRSGGVGMTAIGTVVAAFTYFDGAVSYGGFSAVSGPGGGAMFAVAESDGSPRFGRGLSAGVGVVASAVDPAGRVAILTRGSGCGDAVWRWNLAGDLRWGRSWANGGCDGSGVVLSTSIATDPTTHDVVVGGGFTGTQDFGTGPVTSRGGSDDVVVDLAP